MITTPMEKLLKNDAKFEWSHECQGSLDTLKKKMVTTPILVSLDWMNEFHILGFGIPIIMPFLDKKLLLHCITLRCYRDHNNNIGPSES